MDELIRVFIAIFVVMEPFASLPAFLTMTRNMHWKDRNRAANKAVVVAALTLVIFTLIGPGALGVLGVSMKSFQVAGGVMLFFIAAQFVLGFQIAKEEHEKLDVAVVLIAVPLITGPGAMTTAVILSANEGLNVVIAGALLASAACWVVFRFASTFHRILGVQGEEILTKLMGLLLGSIAVEFIRSGLGA
jgi:multiple antibiotic resistance protein